MKFKFLSALLAVMLIISTISIPAFAYSRFCEDINFNRFNGSDWTTAGARYGTVSPNASANGTWITYSADANDRENDGKSLKSVVNANSVIKTNPGVKYATPEDAPLKGIIHISASHFIEKHDKTGYMPRTISMVPVTGDPVTIAQYTEYTNYTYIYSNGENKTSTSTKVPWIPGAWNDIDIWLNLDNNSITFKLVSNGTVSYNKSFTNTNDAYKDGIKEIQFYTQTPNWLSTRNDTYAKSATLYWDSIKVETVDSMPSETAKTNTSDFNSYAPSSTITSVMPSVPSGVTWTYANVSGKGVNYEATDKGVSLKYTGSTTATAQLRMNFSPAVTSVKSKFSAQVSDKVSKPLYIITGNNQYVQAALFHDGGSLSMFGRGVLQYKLNHWYDIEYSYNAQNGDYFYRVYDGENEYTGSGVKTQDGLTYPNTIQRVMFQVNKATTASSIIIDDLMLDTIATDFRLDKDLSTNNKTIKNNETVYARFTKELNETPAADKVFEYYGNAEITSVSLLDKYTVKVDFEKEVGKKYRIDFKNIVASDGSTTSDYIEFSSQPAEYINPVFSFTDAGGNKINNLVKGSQINMSTVLKTGTEGNKDAYAFLALYDDGGNLCELDFNETMFTQEGKNEELSVTIPSDASAYRLLAAVWKTDLTPIKKEVLTTPVVIFKLDDLRDYSANHFVDMTSFAEENGIKIGVGIIANTLETASQTYVNAVKTIDNSPNAEIWCHGYTHSYTTQDGVTYAEFNDTVENQSQTLKNCADILKNKCGITVRGLGTPGNYSNENTIKALEQNPQYTTLLASASVGKRLEGSTYIHLSNWMNMESAVDVVKTLDALKTNYESSSKLAPYVLIAGHSYGWNATSKETFKSFVDYLKSKGVTFMTPTEYYNFVS